MTRNSRQEGRFDDLGFANTHIRHVADLFFRSSVLTADEFNTAIEAFLHKKGKSIGSEYTGLDQDMVSYTQLKTFQEGSRAASVIHLPKLDIQDKTLASVSNELVNSLKFEDETFQSFSKILTRFTEKLQNKESCISESKILAVYKPKP